MGSLRASDVCSHAEEWIGYREGDNNWNVFAKILDDCDYFYPQKKQNVPWCATFCDCMCLISATPKDRDDEAKKYDAQYFLFQPSRNNYSAGAKEFAGYFKDADEFYYSNPQVGDMCFFYVNGEIGHVGIVVDTEEYITTIEGNAGDMVQKKWYSYDEIGDRIAGFGRPRYDAELDEPYKPEPPVKDDNKPIPEPVGDESDGERYVVNVGSYLNIRDGADVGYGKVGELYNGAVVTVFETDGNWGRIGGDMWVCMDYLDKE